ncbi:hypothetical protein [Oceanobacter mangrovi]|uniref:hypothetical protein n=1 Tax=Oceanobacter mangrovi TaxID=2862510 RepID=UPI001C8E830B|nr:hypothetical protein [Oceanobacter mangrovi]
MKLIDFSNDLVWQQLRQSMGATDDGAFDLYDPLRHLSHQELRQLASSGIALAASQLLVLKDRTLALKNRRIWLLREDGNGAGQWHVAACDQVNQWRHSNQLVRVSTVTAMPPLKDGEAPKICMACLAEVGYQGIDSRRIRRVDFAEQVSREFRLEAFFREFPQQWGE